MSQKKTLLSGIQPSGRSHIGNYFGAMKQFVDLQDKYNTNISIVNYHALTTVHDAEKLRKDTLNLAIDLLAVGLDPEKTVLFLQSDIPEVAELSWIFNTLVTVAFLERGVEYKNKTSQGVASSAGLLTYPVLQAADILIMNADIVPVGADQKQHLEYTRDIAEKFNNTFGETFNIPMPFIIEDVAIVPGTDGQKMSKSYNNTISLFASDEEIEKAVMGIPTDSKDVAEPKDPKDDIVFQLHKLFSVNGLDEIQTGYEKGGLSYSDSKKKLIANIQAFITPLRDKRAKIAENTDEILQILKNGTEQVRSKTEPIMHRVRESTGLSL